MSVRARDVEIRRPCPVRLDPDRAAGGVKSWYCGHCEKSVHVLSNMTESDARTFLAEREGQDLCVTYAVRRDGSIRFAPEPVPPRAPDLVPVAALGRRRTAAAAAAVGFGLALAACAPHDNASVEGNVRVVDPPAHLDRTAPTIPDAPRPTTPDEVLVDGGLKPAPPPPPEPEELVDGDIEAVPLPPASRDEPCDPPTPDRRLMRRGGAIARPIIP